MLPISSVHSIHALKIASNGFVAVCSKSRKASGEQASAAGDTSHVMFLRLAFV